jgi:hypothetical protein
VLSVLLTFRSFVANFVGNFVDAFYVCEKAVKLGKAFDEVRAEVPDEVTKDEKER